MKVRRVSTNSIFGWFPSEKNGGEMIHYESTIERDAMMHLEFDANVITYKSHPYVISSVAYNAEWHEYTPDIHAYCTTKDRILECKPEAKLDRENTQRQIAIGRDYAASNGYVFELLTDTQLRAGSRLDNYRLVYRYRKLPIDYDRYYQTIDFVRARASPTMREIAVFLSNDEADLSTIPFVIRLICEKTLACDWDCPLTHKSILTLANM